MPYRWTAFDTRFARFAAAIDDDGRLVRFWLHADREPQGVRDDDALAPIRTQVEEYCAGKRQIFDLVTHAETGSDFEHAVWDAMCEIPFGETVTYGAIARKLGQRGGAQAVGIACNRNPIPLVVPCHRVIGANGALIGFGGGLPLKRALLDFESVVAGHPRDLFATR
jgi:methylated-DNA-[protein]-cysteine S-methyltransferase